MNDAAHGSICVGPAYASEIAPLAIRGPLTLWIQACWCIGHFLELGVVTGTQARTDEASLDMLLG